MLALLFAGFLLTLRFFVPLIVHARLPSDRLIQVRLHLLCFYIFIELLWDNRTLERLQIVLFGIGLSIGKVFIFAEDVEYTFRVHVEADSVLEIYHVLFSLLLPFLLLLEGIAKILVYHFSRLTIISSELTLINDVHHDPTLVFIWHLQYEVQELLLHDASEVLHRRWKVVDLTDTAHVAYFHFNSFKLQLTH